MRQDSTFPDEQHAIAQVPSTFNHTKAGCDSATASNSVTLHDDYSPLESERSKDTIFDLSSSDMSQSTQAEPTMDEVTPPSSAASPQRLHAQERKHSPAKSEAAIHLPSVEEPHIGRPATQSPPRSPALHELPAGAKRTASGQVKRASINGIADLFPKTGTSGQVKVSTTTKQGNGSVTELSHQLRTKLTYAMVKVQHGWESRSLHEVESLASQSPRSAISGFTHTIDGRSMISPRSAMTARLQRKWSSSESSEGNGNADAPNTFSAIESPHRQSNQQPNARKALAPPLDIVPSSRRRMTPSGAMRPPSIRPLATQRTPSQNAVLEAEAVETLAFMASPSTSGHGSSAFPGSQSSGRTGQQFLLQPSPLHAHPAAASSLMSPKRVAFTNHQSREAVVDKTALINRMLDDIRGGDDPELERAFAIADRGSTSTRAI